MSFQYSLINEEIAMNKKLLLLFLSFLILGFVSGFAQEDEDVEEQSYRNPSFTQGTTQSIFEDGQPIYDSNWEWLHQTPQGNTLDGLKCRMPSPGMQLVMVAHL
jgi:hypothetical protein